MDGELLIDVVGGDAAIGGYPQNTVLFLADGRRRDLPDVPSVLRVQLAHQGVLLPLALGLEARADGYVIGPGGPLFGGLSDVLHRLTPFVHNLI